MYEHGTIGNGNSGKINIYDDEWFPKISHLIEQLSETERNAVEVLLAKLPTDTWESVAQKLGISTRQLYNIRQKQEVQDAVYIVSKELFKSDIPDVLKALTLKAKSGEGWAIKLFLEVSGELKGKSDPDFDDSSYAFPIPGVTEDNRLKLRV